MTYHRQTCWEVKENLQTCYGLVSDYSDHTRMLVEVSGNLGQLDMLMVCSVSDETITSCIMSS